MNRFSTGIAVASFVAFALPCGNAAAQSVKSVAGSYNIVTAEVFGNAPRGTLMLGADGRYSLVLMRTTLPKFASGARNKGTAEENRSVVDGSIAHVGRYTIDDGGKTLTFHVEASTFPNWDGTTQARPLKVKGDELSYSVAAPSTGANQATELVWKRLK
jgi:hypothetical protein